MRERVCQLVGPRARSMWVSTFHSTCVRILRNQASLLPGLNSNFSIYDADDSRRLLMMIGKDMGSGHQAVLPTAACQFDLQPEERADRSRQGEVRGERGRRRPGAHRRRRLRRIPTTPPRRQRAGLRRSDRRDSRCAAGLSADRAVLPAALPAHPGRRVPGHQPRAVHAGARARRRERDPERIPTTRCRPPNYVSSATPISRSMPSAVPPSATSRTSSATTPTPRRSCSSRTTDRRRTSCRRPTPSSPAMPVDARSDCGPTRAKAS